MPQYKIEHDRPNCIGCGSCAAICPKFWEMADDGKSDLIDSKTRNDSWQEKEIDKENFTCNKEAADSCPVNVIHLTDLKNNHKII